MHDHPHGKAGQRAEVYDQVPPDYWDEAWKNPLQRLWYALRFKAVASLLAHETFHKILDVGCGSGFAVERILRNMGRTAEVYGVDVTDAIVAYAQRARPQFRFAKAKAEQLPFDNAAFDVVLLLDVIEHVDDSARTLREIRRTLKPSGALIVVVSFEHNWLFRVIWWLWLNLRGKVWHEAHLRIYTKRALFEELRREGFSIEDYRSVHLGMSIAVLARKVT